MKKTKNLIFIISLLFINACTSFNEPIKYDPDVERVAGKYEATTFWVPGSHDGGVDILINGGKVEIELKASKEVIGLLIIPDSINSGYAAVNGNFSGNFKINEDTLRFIDTNTFLDNKSLFFHINDTSIVSTNIYAPFGIELYFKKVIIH